VVSKASDEGFWGKRGAGVLMIARGTGRVLLTLRSSGVRNPGTWGLPGGALEEGESPESGARREAAEELGFSGPIELYPAHVFRAEGFIYYNFVGIVGSEFEPVLDWENDAAEWFERDDLPSPLHFGVQELFQRSKDLISSVVDEAQGSANDDQLAGGVLGAMALEAYAHRVRSFSR
jgi:8-oxo-dGTP pyrophosphatase MutT (NUDIX family)